MDRSFFLLEPLIFFCSIVTLIAITPKSSRRQARASASDSGHTPLFLTSCSQNRILRIGGPTMRTLLVGILLVGLSGCATTSETWVPPAGKSELQAKRDKAECEQYVARTHETD